MNPQDNVFAAIDIGTNSIRMAVVRVDAEQRLTTLAQHREVVRLGEGEFETNIMTHEAIARGALVCSKFAEVARGFGAQEIVTLATSAVREADNREEFMDRVREQAGIDVRVISGVEEARLIWLGVSSGVELDNRKALLIDIGGGSTEVIIGNRMEHFLLDSLKLGSIRLSNKFFADPGPVSLSYFTQVQEYVRGVASQIRRKVRETGYDMALGSAGTIHTLSDIIARRNGDSAANSRNVSFCVRELRDTIHHLCRLPLEKRRDVPGMDANRADIILGGAAVLLTLLELFEVERITLSERGLREGILLDHLLREEDARQKFRSFSTRRRSILQLARACNYEEGHAHHTAFLASRLYEELALIGAVNYSDRARELLEYASITHDIGTFLSHSNHQKHAYYLIRNSDLLGFNDTEIDIIANVALYHRKGIPKKKHENLQNLSRSERRLVSVLAAILRVAEGMDRGHLALVKDLRLEKKHHPRRMSVTLISDQDCQMEVWGVLMNRDLFEYVFEMPLEVQTATA
jgi:exopolyphosphatase/guanosine-5'-triphosphate,3'-diphosphate pyrophosphatase